MDSRLDRASKRLAQGVSRRDAMRWIGAGVAGVLGLFGLSKSKANPYVPGPGQSCESFCDTYVDAMPDADYHACKKACDKCRQQHGIVCPSYSTAGVFNCCADGSACCTSGVCCAAGTRCCVSDDGSTTTVCCTESGANAQFCCTDTTQAACCSIYGYSACGTSSSYYGLCGPYGVGG